MVGFFLATCFWLGLWLGHPWLGLAAGAAVVLVVGLAPTDGLGTACVLIFTGLLAITAVLLAPIVFLSCLALKARQIVWPPPATP